MEMQRQSETLDKLIPDLVSLQGDLPNVKKDATNPHFNKKYADLASVCETLRPLLKSHGFAVTHQTLLDDNRPLLVTTLWHSSGQFLRAVSSITPEKPTFQGVGSAITYTRRYDLMALVGLAPDDDDDGNGAGAKQRASQERKPPKSNGQAAEKPPTTWPDILQRAEAAIAKTQNANECSQLLDKLVKTFEKAPDATHDTPLRRMADHLLALAADGKVDERAAQALTEVIRGRLRDKSAMEELQEEAVGVF